MSKRLRKPQGRSGPIALGGGKASWQVIGFPEDQAERENLVATLFIQSFERWVRGQSKPSFAPFGRINQNLENDLDFTVETAEGRKYMELAEFAPLREHGPKFDDAPLSLDPQEKAGLALELIQKKSAHQGGADRFLLIYTTEQGFWLDPITIERMRRELAQHAPRFDRVFYTSLHDQDSASTSEVFPGTSDHLFGELDLDHVNVFLPHPMQMMASRTFSAVGKMPFGVWTCDVSYTITYHGFEKL